tara:strand:- start:1129 stop:1284 length:156 start_codon:yes stop_codon:yes gene_type:complete
MNNTFEKDNLKSFLNKKDKIEQSKKRARDLLKTPCDEQLSEEEYPEIKDEN